ncbi:MAG: radical SAM protein [Deltaproteobacteria bacterium]|nr:radical SAM protein [Deltaproteobacteria bacterium]
MKEFSEFKIINHLDRFQAVLRGELPLPVTAELDPTNECNHRCPWCLDAHLRNGPPATMPAELIFRLLDELGSLGVKAVTVKGGGEPLVHPDIDQVLYRAREAGLECGLITNGELLEDHLEAVIDCCSWVRVSLAAATSQTHDLIQRPLARDTFGKTLRGLSAVAPRVLTGLVMVVGRPNLGEMAEVARLGRDLGARYLAFKQAVLPGKHFTARELRAMEDIYLAAKEELETPTFQVMGSRVYQLGNGDEPQPYRLCKAHHLVAIVCADAGMYACCSTRGNQGFRYGSLKKQSFAQIWESKRRKQILAGIDRGSCRALCLGRTSYMRYDHYNQLFDYLADPDKPHKDFL